jgi:putative transposase
MSRGNRKLPIFEDDVDRRRFLGIVSEAAKRYHLSVYEGCLMGNHYHFVLDAPRSNLSDAMRFINGVFCQASNRRHNRTGHLFEARFHSVVVQRAWIFRHICRYVVLNPVEAGIASTATDWPWSTYRATAGLESAPPWLDTTWITWAFKAQRREDAQRKYQEYVNRPEARKRKIKLNAVALGTAAFKKALHQAVTEPHEALLMSSQAPRKESLELLFADFAATGNNRDLGIYESHVTHGYSLTEVARFLELNRTTVSKALSRFRGKGNVGNTE